MSVKSSIKFHFDPVSPWAYFALPLLKRHQAVWDYDLVYKPVFLGGVMMGSGNKPPITVPNKGAHMGIEMALVAKFAGIKYKFPTPFPVNTINCVRLLRVIEDKAPAQLAAATDLFFAAVWGPEAQAQTAITLPGCFDVVKSLFDEATLKAYIEESGAAANKDRIKADAAKLVAEGAFGFPWIVVTRSDGVSANFFGSDRMELIGYFLGKPYAGPNPLSAPKL